MNYFAFDLKRLHLAILWPNQTGRAHRLELDLTGHHTFAIADNTNYSIIAAVAWLCPYFSLRCSEYGSSAGCSIRQARPSGSADSTSLSCFYLTSRSSALVNYSADFRPHHAFATASPALTVWPVAPAGSGLWPSRCHHLLACHSRRKWGRGRARD